jgi:hypothetical protein
MSSDKEALESLEWHQEEWGTSCFPGQLGLANENERWVIPLLCKLASPLCLEQ